MEEKINKRLFLIGILALLLTAVSLTVTFGYTFDAQTKRDIRREANIISRAYAAGGELSDLASEGVRITLIAPDGAVLYESDADAAGMDNHLERPEIRAALEKGTGEDTRRSPTLGYRTYYYAQRTQSGDVLRIAVEAMTMYAGFERTLLVVALIALVILAVSVGLSVLLTKQLVRPIEEMAQNLDAIDEKVPYPELEPFARRIKEQQMRKNEIDRMRREFTANVSHELKTPLTSISGYAELIESGMARPEDVSGFAGKIRAEAARLVAVIGDIIELTEVEGATELAAERVELRAVAAETAEMLGFAAEKAGVALTYRGSKCFVTGDRNMLGELVYNLCDNAIRYNRPGGAVEIVTEHDEHVATLTVRDNGIGIAPVHQNRVFERFYRVDKSRSKSTGGTGLGLAIVKHIAIRHGADIRVRSEEGEGTEITVTFRSAPEIVE